MKFNVESKALYEAIKYASSFTSKGVVGGSIKVSIGIDCMTFSGFDGSLWASKTIKCDSPEVHEFMVNPLALIGLSSLKCNELSLSYTPEKGRLIIDWGDGKSSMSTFNDEITPESNVTDYTTGPVILDLNALKAAVRAVYPARSGKSGGTMWENLFLWSDVTDKHLHLFASDQARFHRIALCECNETVAIPLSQACIKAINSMNVPDGDTVKFYSGERMVKIESFRGYEVKSQLPSGNMSERWKVILTPGADSEYIEVAEEYLDACIDRAMHTHDLTTPVKLSIELAVGDIQGNNRLIFSSASINPPFAIKENLPYTGGDIGETMVNAKYLLDAIRSSKAETVRIIKDKRGFLYITDQSETITYDSPGFIAVIASKHEVNTQ